MSAPVIQIERSNGRGRQPNTIEATRDARDDLAAHHAEALAFCDAAWPLVSRLEMAAQHLGPIAHKTALLLGTLLASYERRHLPDEPIGQELAA